MTKPEVVYFGRMPFLIGTFDTPRNPDGLPNVVPFRLLLDENSGLLVQESTDELERLLSSAYSFGSLVGNAMDDTPLGRKYCEDFLDYLVNILPNDRKARILEIGAGRGYLCRRLLDLGHDMIAIEPGNASKPFWEKHRVEVIQDFFPSKWVPGPFDFIIAYGVLEHIERPGQFLQAVSDHLAVDGAAVFAVPDCGADITAGDPSMLLHEHFLYFTPSSLVRVLQQSRFKVIRVTESGYGRSLYCTAVPDQNATPKAPSPKELALAREYGRKCEILQQAIREQVHEIADSGKSLGVFVPSRALSVLPQDVPLRFFDDDEELRGKYYPPFPVPVEGRDTLYKNPVDELWIMSRTFGSKLAGEIRGEPTLGQTEIRMISELVG